VVETFDRIYRDGSWGGRGCGPGSEHAATALLERVLPELVAGVEAWSVLDAACGDGSWMPVLPVHRYVGVDVVPAAVEAAREAHPFRTYLVGDIRSDPLPRVDLVICRDAMMHMPLEDGLAALANLRRTGATWLVLTSFAEGRNEDVAPGDFYHINLEAAPFALGKPWTVIEDDWRHPDKFLGVWANSQ